MKIFIPYQKRILLILSVTFLIIVSCHQQIIFDKNIRIKDHSWNIADTVQFITHISDTAQYYDLFIQTRNGGLYEYSNLFVFIIVEAPNGFCFKDTLEIELSDKNGKWHGKGLGDIKSLSTLYKNEVRFSMPGIYKFKIIQGMRTNELINIFDVGLRITKSQKTNKSLTD